MYIKRIVFNSITCPYHILPVQYPLTNTEVCIYLLLRRPRYYDLVGGMRPSAPVDNSHQRVIYHRHIPHIH